jgi:hypothetical protein
MTLPEVYAASDGWAATFDIDLMYGSTFEWRGRKWMVVTRFTFPCCSRTVTLVRAEGSGLHVWSGLECEDHPGPTYTVERRMEDPA